MQVISKIKKVEDGNSYNQMKSSAIVDDYNSIVKPFSKVEDGDTYKRTKSSAIVDDYNSIVKPFSKVEDGNSYKFSLTKSYIDNVDDSVESISVVEKSNFYNLNLAHSYIDNVDDSIEPISVVEKSNFYNLNLTHSYIDNDDDFIEDYTVIKEDLTKETYKIVLTFRGNGAKGFKNAEFSKLTYVECLSEYNDSALSEDVVFSDEDENTYRCRITVSSRYQTGVNYAPHNLFAPSDKRESPFQEVTSANNSDPFVVEIQFIDSINLSMFKNLRIETACVSGFIEQNVEYSVIDASNITVKNEVIDGMPSEFIIYNVMYYKIVISKTQNNYLAHGVFANLTFDGRVTENYTSNITSVDVRFLDASNNPVYCTCSYPTGSRWNDNGHRDYAPCNFFARTQSESWATDSYSASAYTEIAAASNGNLVYQILFTTKIPIEYISPLTFDNGRYGSSATVNVKVYESDDLIDFTEIVDKDITFNNGLYTFTIE